jgi:Flp pilus assembly CpaE family ATPase
MEIWIQSDDGRVKRATFDTDGCGPSIASGSMATELAIGRSLTEVARIRQQDILEALGGLTEESKHCALLAANTLKAAVTDCLERRKAQTPKEEHRDTTCGECEKEDCSAKTAQPDESEEQLQERQALARRLCQIEHKILVLSGKGGVGKSTVAVNLAVSLSLSDVRRCVTFCRQLRMPVLGVVENMSGFACPKCGEVTDIFKSGGGERMSKEMDVPFLGRIPIDPKIAQACDDGRPYVHHYAETPTAKAFQQVIGPILGLPNGVPHERDLRS